MSPGKAAGRERRSAAIRDALHAFSLEQARTLPSYHPSLQSSRPATMACNHSCAHAASHTVVSTSCISHAPPTHLPRICRASHLRPPTPASTSSSSRCATGSPGCSPHPRPSPPPRRVRQRRQASHRPRLRPWLPVAWLPVAWLPVAWRGTSPQWAATSHHPCAACAPLWRGRLRRGGRQARLRRRCGVDCCRWNPNRNPNPDPNPDPNPNPNPNPNTKPNP